MFPIRDINPSRTVPVVNYGLIGANILVFLVQLAQGPYLDEFNYLWGLVPARYFDAHVSSYFGPVQQTIPFLSYMFLHGGFMHILGNLWFLYIFGDNVEDHLGPYRYLGFYLLCGIASGLTQMMFDTQANIPLVGASGAIAGVMGAYILLHPRAKILTLIPVFIIPFFFEIPAIFFLGFWLLIQFFNATLGGGSNVAWWAHIGGFLFGAVFLKLFGRLPETGLTRVTRPLAERRNTHRLQVIQPTGPSDDPNLYGEIVVSPREALNGASKIVNIPWGFHNRLFRVTVPPGSGPGTILRLAGLGKRRADGGQGDVMLSLKIAEPWN